MPFAPFKLHDPKYKPMTPQQAREQRVIDAALAFEHASEYGNPQAAALREDLDAAIKERDAA